MFILSIILYTQNHIILDLTSTTKISSFFSPLKTPVSLIISIFLAFGNRFSDLQSGINIMKYLQIWKATTIDNPWQSSLQFTVSSDHFDYVAVSASVFISVPKLGESKSGQMVSEKVKWA